MTLLRPGVRRPCPACEAMTAWFEASPPDRFGARGYWSDDPSLPLNPHLDSDDRPRKHLCEPATLREVMLRRGPLSAPMEYVPEADSAPSPPPPAAVPVTSPQPAPARPRSDAQFPRPVRRDPPRDPPAPPPRHRPMRGEPYDGTA